MRTTTEVFEDHLAKRLAREIREDIEQNYATNAIIMTGTGIFTGHSGVHKSAQELSDYVKNTQFEYRHTLVQDVYAFLVWTAHSKRRQVLDGADSFVIQNGKIIFQSIHYSISKK